MGAQEEAQDPWRLLPGCIVLVACVEGAGGRLSWKTAVLGVLLLRRPVEGATEVQPWTLLRWTSPQAPMTQRRVP